MQELKKVATNQRRLHIV